MKSFKQMTDQRLDGLRWNTAACMHRLRSRERRSIRRPAAAALAMVLALLTATALAIGLQMSRQVEVKRVARQTVMQTYGLDETTISLFTAHATEKDGVWTVRFTTEKKRDTGEYSVTIAKDGTALAEWSLEGEANAWGHEEIAAYLQRKTEEYHEMRADESLSVRSTREPEPVPTPVPGARMTHAQVIETANEALRTQYDFTDLGLSPFDAEPAFGGGTWIVRYTAFGWRWPDGYLSEKAGEYTVRISDADGTVLSTEWSLKGQAVPVASREELGSAAAYDARCMEWAAEIMAERDRVFSANEESRYQVDAAELARLDAIMIAHGFSAEKYNHVAPGETDLSYEEATELAAQVLEKEFGLKRETFDACSFAYADLTQEQNHRQWYFWIQDLEDLMSWTVTLNAETGEILDLGAETLANSNG